MFNCRSIPPEMWIHARKCMIFFFSRRSSLKAEDLAQETLMTVWSREDYRFEKEEDFLKVCYGFARKILLEGYRENSRHAGDELGIAIESRVHEVKGLAGNEVNVFLEEVCRRANTELQKEEWALIQSAIDRHSQGQPVDSKRRVQLHRARKKLAKLTGWR